MKEEKKSDGGNFIHKIIDADTVSTGCKVRTRFPPEPNGYLHIGHAKSIVLNFTTAEKYNGTCNLRFDDTNPEKEELQYAESIQEDIKWLGFDWGGNLFYTSDYFEKLYGYAVVLIKKGLAYVDDETSERIRETRGTLTEPGTESPFRKRTVSENLELFRRMREGEFPDGSRVLRAKIDMASPNLTMRDPALYRIKHMPHQRSGGKWCIYPMYDFAHCLSDSIEGITHSLCTLEFENNRPLYNWILEKLEVKYRPRQIEFARLNMSYTVLSKRKLLRLVKEGFVNGWDDPRMPTISGLRRRGYTSDAIKDFCGRIGVARTASVVDAALLEHCAREDLNARSPRVMAVLEPLKVVIENYPDGKSEELDAVNHPDNPAAGVRKIHFSREIFIEKSDFMERPPSKYFRLAPGCEVRLKHAYYIKCVKVIKNEKTGDAAELRCVYDAATRGGNSPDGRKVKGTLHWVSARHSLPAEVRIYDKLFLKENPENASAGEDFISNINPDSLKVIKGCLAEHSLSGARPGDRFQFIRHGYFCLDKESSPAGLVFNRTVPLKDTWAKINKK